MTELKLSGGCVTACPYLESLQGSCGHDLRPLIVTFLREHPDKLCPVYESERAETMRELAERLEHQAE